MTAPQTSTSTTTSSEAAPPPPATPAPLRSAPSTWRSWFPSLHTRTTISSRPAIPPTLADNTQHTNDNTSLQLSRVSSDSNATIRAYSDSTIKGRTATARLRSQLLTLFAQRKDTSAQTITDDIPEYIIIWECEPWAYVVVRWSDEELEGVFVRRVAVEEHVGALVARRRANLEEVTGVHG